VKAIIDSSISAMPRVAIVRGAASAVAALIG
jgi:hypothetical protein